MTVNWAGFAPYVPPLGGPFSILSRRDARKAYEHLMESKSARIEELRNLLSRNHLVLSDDDQGIQRLDDWFRAEVEGDPVTGRLDNVWYAVVNDLYLFIGDALIARRPELKWQFFQWGNKSYDEFQRPVIMGFDVPNRRFNLDLGEMVARHGHRVVLGYEEPTDVFLRIVNTRV